MANGLQPTAMIFDRIIQGLFKKNPKSKSLRNSFVLTKEMIAADKYKVWNDMVKLSPMIWLEGVRNEQAKHGVYNSSAASKMRNRVVFDNGEVKDSFNANVRFSQSIV